MIRRSVNGAALKNHVIVGRPTVADRIRYEKRNGRGTLVVTRPCHACNGKGYREYRGYEYRARRKQAGLGLRELARLGKVTAPYLCDVQLSRRAVSDTVRAIYDKWCP